MPLQCTELLFLPAPATGYKGPPKAASAIKADKISCTLSIRRAYSAGNELIQQKITLQDPEIANICFSAKNALAAMHQAQDAAIKRGDSVAMHEWEKKMVEECHRIGAALSLLPTRPC